MEYEKLLSAGALQQILDGQKPANPVFQIVGYKQIPPEQMELGKANDELRYRVMLGDGFQAYQYCVMTNQDIVQDLKSNKLEKWSLVRITSYHTVEYGEGTPSKRTLIYLLNLDVITNGSEVGQRLHCQGLNPQQSAAAAAPQQNNMMINRTPTNNQQQENHYNSSNNYYNPTQPKPYPMGGDGMQQDLIRSPRAMRNSHEHQTISISELTPYIGKWVIKARVTVKGAIREYNNAKGGGKLFNFTLADKTGEIKVTAFNADCDRVFPYVEPNKVYLLGRAQVKAADKRYTTADYEITLGNDSMLEEVMDARDAKDIPLARFNFVSIASLQNQPQTPVDLIGAIITVEEISTIISKTKNKELRKRNIVIVDMSRHTVSVTLWNELADNFKGIPGDVFVTKAARVGTYGGRSASAGDCMFVNPDIPECRKIKHWYDKLLDTNFVHLTQSESGGSAGDQWKLLDDLLDMEKARAIQSSGNQSAAYAKCKILLMQVGKNPVYKCCPTEGCNKKLVDTQNNELKCEKCQQTFSTYKYRYKTDILVCDAKSSSWVTLWDANAEQVLGLKPEQLETSMKMENKDNYERIINRPNFNEYIVTFRSRIDNYNNEERVKLGVTQIRPLDPVSYSRRLIEEIKSMSS